MNTYLNLARSSVDARSPHQARHFTQRLFNAGPDQALRRLGACLIFLLIDNSSSYYNSAWLLKVKPKSRTRSQTSQVQLGAGVARHPQNLSKGLKFEPHEYRIEGVLRSLDAVDLLAVIPTGGGKISFFFVYILVIQALAQDEKLEPSCC